MTLEEFANKNNLKINDYIFRGTLLKYIVSEDWRLMRDAFHLTDCVVSSVCGITYWFISKS